MRNRSVVRWFSALLLTLGMSAALPALGQSLEERTGLQAAANAGGIERGISVYSLIGNIIRYVLGLLGAIFLILVIIGGLQWMTSGGNEAAVKAARQRITRAVIGLAIVLAAYAITTFVITQLTSATTGAQ